MEIDDAGSCQYSCPTHEGISMSAPKHNWPIKGPRMQDPAMIAPDPVREGVGTSGSKRNWPNNCWWGVAHGSELGQTPSLRRALEMPIALYRLQNGTPAALHNR